ncbi:MAG: HD-GYP domain-containing protein, partial [Planctomycetota bacterium]
QKALDGIVRATALTVEMRDPYTAGHQKRVADLACVIAGECGLSEDQIEGIRMAGIIHDLGKISVPAEILSKPSRLTQNEFNLIKEHPEVGYDILKELEFPWPIAKMVLQHHEKFDGSGYPRGLSGEEILIEARVIAVADVVEAMASHRPYRPSKGITKALAEIVKNKGIHYDPEIVDACIKIFKEKKFTME